MGDSKNPSASASEATTKPFRRLAPWQIVLCTLAALCMVGGIALAIVGPTPDPAGGAVDGASGGGAAVPGVTGLAPGQPGFDPSAPGSGDAAGGGEGSGGETGYARPLFQLGFSFAVAFAIAFALRSFLKAATIVLGLFLLMLFGLQYLGVVEVRWDELGARYDSASAWLGAQTESFSAFIRGQLPAAGSAAVGGIAGFRRK